MHWIVENKILISNQNDKFDRQFWINLHNVGVVMVLPNRSMWEDNGARLLISFRRRLGAKACDYCQFIVFCSQKPAAAAAAAGERALGYRHLIKLCDVL